MEKRKPERAKQQVRWLDVGVVIGAAGLMLGLALWATRVSRKWDAIPRYLFVLPVGLLAYWFGRKGAWIGASAGATLIGLSLSGSIASSGLSPRLLQGLMVAVLLFPVALIVAQWGRQRRGVEKSNQRPLEEAAILTDIGTAASESLDLSTTLDAILSSTQQLIPYDLAEITLWDEERQCCVTQGWGGKRAYAQETGGVYHRDEGYTGWIIQNRRPLLIPDVQARHDVRPKVDTAEFPFRSYLGIPLQSRGRFVGTLELVSYRENVYSERDRDTETLQAIGRQAATAIENAFLYKQAQRRAEQRAGLARLAAVAGSTLDLDELLDRLMGETIQLLNAEKGVLLLHDEEEEALTARYLASAGADREAAERFRIPTDAEGFEHSIFARGGSYFCNDPRGDPELIPAYRPHIQALGVQNFAGVAVRLKDRSIGELYLGNREGGFGPEEVQVLKTVAGYFAAAIENSRLYEEARHRASELASLAETSATVSESLELEHVFQTLTSAVLDVVGGQASAIFVLDETQRVLRLAMSRGLSEAYTTQSQIITLESGGRAHAVATGETLIVPDVRADGDLGHFAPLAAQEGIRAFADIPLKRADRTVGMLSVAFEEPHTFPEMETELLAAFADQAAIAIDNARLYAQTDERLQRRVEALSGLQRVTREINATLNLDRILKLVLEEAIGLSDAVYGAILLQSAENDKLELDVSAGYSDTAQDRIHQVLQEPEAHPALAEVLRDKQSLLVSQASRYQSDAAPEIAGDPIGFASDANSMLIVPIFYAEALAGLLVLESPEEEAFGHEMLEFAEGLSAQAAIAIGNARRYQKQLERGELLSRRAEQLSSVLEVDRALRSDRPLEDVLGEIAYAVQESVGFDLVLISVLEGDPPYQRRMAAAGIPIPEFERMKKVQQPWSLVEEIMDEKFRISQSYYLPADRQAGWRERADIYTAEEGSDVASKPGRWHPNDLLLVPLIGPKGDVQGLLSVDQPRDGEAPDRSTIETLEIFAAHAALAIENAQMVKELQRRAEIMALFNEISQSTTAKLGLDEVLDDVVNRASQLLDCKHSIIFLLDERTGEYVPRASHGPLLEQTSDPRAGVVEQVAKSGMPLVIDDVKDEPDFSPGSDAIRSLVLTPLIVGERVDGVLCVGRGEPGSFDPAEVAMLSALADQVSVAVENAHLFEETQRRAVQLEAAAEVARDATAILDVDQLLNETVHLISDEFGFYHAAVFLVDEADEHAVLRAASSEGGQRMLDRGHKLGVGKVGIVGHVAATGEPRIAVDVGEDGFHFASPDLPETRSEMALPLVSRDRVIGVLDVQSRRRAAFDEDDVAILRTMAGQLANAIENAQLYEEAQQRAIQLGTLNRIGRQMVSILDQQELLQQAVDAVKEDLGYFQAAVLLVDEEDRLLHMAAATDNFWEVIPDNYQQAMGTGVIGTAAETRESVLIDNSAESSLPFRAGDWLSPSSLSVPIETGERVIGVLEVEDDVPNAFDEEDRIAMEIMADQVAISIENIRLYEETRRRLADAELVQEVALAAASTLDFDLVLERAVKALHRERDIDRLGFLLPDERDEVLIPHPSLVGRQGDFEVPFEDGLVGRAYRTGRPVAISDLAENPDVFNGDEGSRSAMALPVRVSDEVAGVLHVEAPEANVFDEDERRFFTTIAGQLGVALESARLFEEVRSFSEEMEQRVEERTKELADAMEELTKERDRVETLYRITSELSASLDLGHVLDKALGLVVEAVGADRASTLMLDQDTGQLIYRAALGADGDLPPEGRPTRFSRGEGLAGWVVEHREAAIVPDIQEDARWVEPEDQRREYRSALAVPLMMGDEVLGSLLLLHESRDYFTEEHLHLVEAAATQVANAINNANLYNVIREQAERLGGMLKAQQVEAAKSQAILEGVADGVMVADAQGEVILFNAAAERILDLPRDKAMGRTTREMLGLYGGRAQDWLETIAQWQEHPKSYQAGEYLAAQLNIEDRIVSVHLAPVVMKREFLGTVSVFRDVTAEVEADRAKTEFVSMVSHELRTPMTSIKGYADLLLMEAVGDLGDDQRRFLSIIKNNADRLKMLVDDLLDISRIESGRLEIEIGEAKVEEVIDRVIATMRTQAEEKGLDLYSEVPTGLPPVRADHERVSQILTNLIDNACRYTPEGGEVAVSASMEEDEVLLSVEDTGIGIATEDQEKIFERFFRADDPVVQENPGTGLGLSIVQSLVEMQGGEVWVESGVGEGSTFSFTLPTVEAASPEPGSNHKAEQRDGPPTKVLIVEDDHDVARLIRLNLAEDGREIMTAHKGEEALEIARREQPDLITLDILLPDIDGFEVLESLKADSTTREIPVIVVSVVPDKEKNLRLGAVDYVPKPIDEEQLLQAARKILPHRGSVLIVDDDQDNLSMMREVLCANEFEVDTAQRGQQALQIARDKVPSLILLDLNLRDGDGREVLKRLKETPETQEVPVIVMTGSEIIDRSERHKIHTLGAVRLMDKPFSVDELMEEIESAL